MEYTFEHHQEGKRTYYCTMMLYQSARRTAAHIESAWKGNGFRVWISNGVIHVERKNKQEEEGYWTYTPIGANQIK
jgi:hypothetical protein